MRDDIDDSSEGLPELGLVAAAQDAGAPDEVPGQARAASTESWSGHVGPIDIVGILEASASADHEIVAQMARVGMGKSLENGMEVPTG